MPIDAAISETEILRKISPQAQRKSRRTLREKRVDFSTIELNTDNTDLTDRHGLKLQVFLNNENHE
jgi:hypothetical protein